jgi:hypothetical protein
MEKKIEFVRKNHVCSKESCLNELCSKMNGICSNRQRSFKIRNFEMRISYKELKYLDGIKAKFQTPISDQPILIKINSM